MLRCTFENLYAGAPYSSSTRCTFNNNAGIYIALLAKAQSASQHFLWGTLPDCLFIYILPHFYYCSSVWHFCGACDADKVEALNKRTLRFILGDYSSPYSCHLKKVNSTSLANKRVQNFLILLYKSLFFPHFLTCSSPNVHHKTKRTFCTVFLKGTSTILTSIA